MLDTQFLQNQVPYVFFNYHGFNNAELFRLVGKIGELFSFDLRPFGVHVFSYWIDAALMMGGFLMVSSLGENFWNSGACERSFVAVEMRDFSKVLDCYGKFLK